MSDDHVLTRIAKDERIAWMTLNRPAKKNALSNKMMDKMIADIKTITEDRDILVLVLSANGDSFCSGLDLFDLRESNKKEHRFGRSESTREITQLLRKMPQITIASVQGWCLGGGIALLNACDRHAGGAARILWRGRDPDPVSHQDPAQGGLLHLADRAQPERDRGRARRAAVPGRPGEGPRRNSAATR
jgi:1,4-dihydroxy-2-naphthoyl-CoA synthase